MQPEQVTPDQPRNTLQGASWVRSLRGLILFSIAVGAAVAIVALLGVEVGDTGWKIVGTAFSITGAALVSLPPVAAWERKGSFWLPVIGVAAAVSGFGLLIGFIWVEPSGDVPWKFPGTLIIVAVAISAASLLLFARLEQRALWVLTVTRTLLGVVAVMLVVAIWGEIEASAYWRGFGVASVLLAAFLASVPVLRRVGRRSGTAGYCPMCGASNPVAVGAQATCSTCGGKYRVSV